MKVTYGTNGPITVADVMVIPAGRHGLPVSSRWAADRRHRRRQADYAVIHSFWVPQLFGKQDVVPGSDEPHLFSADHPGTYSGQCAEFCGLEHGKMKCADRGARPERLGGVGRQPEAAPSVTPTDPLAAKGMDLFSNPLSGDRGSCMACHSIGGTSRGVNAAPEPDALRRSEPPVLRRVRLGDGRRRRPSPAWLHDPNAVKLGAKMPNYHLTQQRDRRAGGLPREPDVRGAPLDGERLRAGGRAKGIRRPRGD